MTAEIVAPSPIEGKRKQLLFLVANALILWMIHGTIVSRCRCGALSLWGETPSAWHADAKLRKKTQFCNFVFPIRPAPCGISSLKN